MADPTPTSTVPSYIVQPFLRSDLNPPKPDSEKAKAIRGELFCAFTPALIAERARAGSACRRYNATALDSSRRQKVEMIREILQDPTPLPPSVEGSNEEADSALFALDPWIEPPFLADYGTNLTLGSNVFINFNCVVLDTCAVKIGARTLVGPNVYFYSGTHPTDHLIRDGTQGPELGKPITVEEDVWIAGNVTILPGVTIGRGATVGAGSVVTKSVEPYTVVAGNPARFLKRLKRPEEEREKEEEK